MLQKFLDRYFRPRHYWRDVGFSELSELYSSVMLRSLALSLVGIFVPVYLLKLGFSLGHILLFYTVFFGTRQIIDIFAGYVVARIGPKHTFVISYLLQICALSMFATISWVHWPLYMIAPVWGASNSMFFVAFHVDFSKIKHSKHGGKEVGFMSIMEKAGGFFGPVIGGVIATVFGAKYTFLGAVVLFIAGLVPLFMTGEVVKTHQIISFAGLPLQRIKRDLIAYAGLGVENTLCVISWPIYMTLFVLKDNTYARIGIISTVSVGMSILAIKAIGSLVDDKKGRTLLRFGAFANSAVYLVRPFIASFAPALGLGVVNEAVTVAYRIPFTKGMYDAADSLPGYRIAYISAMESLGDCCKFAVFGVLWQLSYLLPAYTLLCVAFFVAATASIVISTERFRALK